MINFKIGDKVMWKGKKAIIIGSGFSVDSLVIQPFNEKIVSAKISDLTPVVAENATTHTSTSPLGIKPKELSFEDQIKINKDRRSGFTNEFSLLQFIEWLKLKINENQFSQSGNMVDANFYRNKYENADCELEKLKAENENLKACLSEQKAYIEGFKQGIEEAKKWLNQ